MDFSSLPHTACCYCLSFVLDMNMWCPLATICTQCRRATLSAEAWAGTVIDVSQLRIVEREWPRLATLFQQVRLLELNVFQAPRVASYELPVILRWTGCTPCLYTEFFSLVHRLRAFLSTHHLLPGVEFHLRLLWTGNLSCFRIGMTEASTWGRFLGLSGGGGAPLSNGVRRVSRPVPIDDRDRTH